MRNEETYEDSPFCVHGYHRLSVGPGATGLNEDVKIKVDQLWA